MVGNTGMNGKIEEKNGTTEKTEEEVVTSKGLNCFMGDLRNCDRMRCRDRGGKLRTVKLGTRKIWKEGGDIKE